MPPLASVRSRLVAAIPALLLLSGSVVFIAAGRHHPRVGGALGTVGSPEYFVAFAHEIVRTHGWESMHAMILAGPMLWALGVAGLARALPGHVAALGDIGRAALLLAAAAWGVAFVLDGFVAPELAREITDIARGADSATALAAFETNQRIVARLGMVSVVLMGAGIVALALALTGSARAASWRFAVGAAGLFIGGWPLYAAARGEFDPGPFTSPYWTLTALMLAAWFALLATTARGSAVEDSAAPASPVRARQVESRAGTTVR